MWYMKTDTVNSATTQ